MIVARGLATLPRACSRYGAVCRSGGLGRVGGVAGSVPRQLWTCPDATAPHGYTTHGGYADPPRADCRAAVIPGDQVLHFLLVAPGWLPLVVGKSLS
jgi:hypothetical protein